MFYDTEYTFAQMAFIWAIVTVIWGVSFVAALKLGRIELEPAQKVLVILVTSLTALFPAIGIFLAPVVAIFLIYRMADSQLPIIIGVVVVTRFIAALVAIGAERALMSLGVLRG
jgi:hypothetical protein